MRRIALYLIMAVSLFMCSAIARAQTDGLLERLYSKFASSCVELDYDYVTRMSGVKVAGSGTLYVQGNMWYMTGNCIEIWCDGKTVWTVDPFAEEVIIESVSEENTEELVNPALMFVRMQEHFNVSKTLDSADGKASIFVLEPKADIGMDFFNVEILKSSASIRGGLFAMSDGNEVKITVSSMKQVEKKSATFFKPSQTFNSSWIVTDLR